MTHLRELYRAERLPVFQNRMFASREEARAGATGDVVLVQDVRTGLIFNNAFDPDLVVYDEDYQNEQAVSAVFRQHLDEVMGVIHRWFRDRSVIEVGCGKGHFLERLLAEGYEVTGLDPTYQGDNPAVVKEYFTPGSGLSAETLVLRHVLEHVQDPVAFLADIAAANGGRGQIYIEVPCFDWILANRTWFDIFYEHVNYFRQSDLGRMFGTVLESGRVFGGQYLYIVADLATLKTPVAEDGDRVDFPTDFLSSMERSAAHLQGGDTGAPTAIWGGASKGVIFSLFMERAGQPVDLVIDINTAKQGKFLPATGLQVQPPAALDALPDGADLVVMNRNYLSEIQEMTQSRFNYVLVENG